MVKGVGGKMWLDPGGRKGGCGTARLACRFGEFYGVWGVEDLGREVMGDICSGNDGVPEALGPAAGVEEAGSCGLGEAGEFDLWDGLRCLGQHSVGSCRMWIGKGWEKGALLLKDTKGTYTAKFLEEEEFWVLSSGGSWRSAPIGTNRHRSALGCREGYELGTPPRRLSHVLLLSQIW